MSAAGKFVQIFNYKYILFSILSAPVLIFSQPAGAEPVSAQGAVDAVVSTRQQRQHPDHG